MKNQTEIIKMIEKLVEEKTFSLEGAKAIAELKKLTEATQDMLKEYETKLEWNKKTIDELRAINSELNEQIKRYKDREKAIEDREKHANNNETRVAVAEAKHSALYDVFNTIFKNTIVREHIQKTGVVHSPSPYPGGSPTTHNVPGEAELKTTQTE